MTDSELIDAASIVLNRYGLSVTTELQSLLPGVIARFVESNIWEFLIVGPVAVSSVAGKEYLSLPNDFLKMDSLWSETLGYALDFKNRKTWSRYKAANPNAAGSPRYYTQFAKRVYTFPPAGAAEVFKCTYYPAPLNLQLGSIPFGHYAILNMLIEDWLPVGKPDSSESVVKSFYGTKAKDALAEAIAVQNLQPDTQEDERLDPMQETLNSIKGGGFVPRTPFTQ